MARQNKILHELLRPYSGCQGRIDLAELRRGFAALMDQGAMAIQSDGYDQDDCLIERFFCAHLRGHGSTSTVEIPIDSLTDISSLLKPLHDTQGPTNEDFPIEIEIVNLGIRVIYEEGVPRPGLQGNNRPAKSNNGAAVRHSRTSDTEDREKPS